MTISDMQAALIGGGFIGPVHVEALRRLGVNVTGVLGSTPERGQRTADSLGLPRAYESLDALLADDAVDVVHIASPNRHHFAQAKAALDAGKHVLCEKPLAMTTAETAELVDAAARSGRATGVNYNVRYYPLCREAAARVPSDVGGVWHVRGAYVQDWLANQSDFNWRVLAEEGGALRAVADIGTHWLDLVQFISGRKVIAVCADLQTVHSTRLAPSGVSTSFGSGDENGTPIEIDTEDAGHILLKFEGGARGSLTVSQVTPGRKNRCTYELAGPSGSLAWDSEQPNELWIGHRDRPNERLLRDPALLTESSSTSYPGGHNEGFPDSFKHLFADFYSYAAAVDRREPSGPTHPSFADGHREVALCEAIVQSHQEQGWVSIPGNSRAPFSS